MATALASIDLPGDWMVTSAGAGVDLRVRATGRIYLQLAAWILALWSGGWTAAHWRELSSGTAQVHLIMSVLLILFAAWCSFADEFWHLEPNLVVHRVGWWSHTFSECELQICMRRSTKFLRPCYKLYAISNGSYRFLIERDLEDLTVLARFMAGQTGWYLRGMMLPDRNAF